MTNSAHAAIDGALRSAVEAREVPGVVALAANEKGLIYEGAFGVRDLDTRGIAATEVIAFVIEAMRKRVSSVIAPLVSRSRTPNAPS